MNSRIIRCGFSLLLIVLASACTSTPSRESAGEYLDSAAITSRIKAAFVADAKIKSLQIEVDTFKGVVQLSGFVNSQEMIDRAVDIARRVRGVKSIQNSLVVKSAAASY